ncbi:MAG: aminoglycoside phosphotransferase family protein [Candidatus Marinimicrobia bacterium]|jgi:thiamine kinase-like enzyme|nr:aminoglycoside phosphotransferase family protein [Candidatus Neomarinimicrobiota bacterium]MBT3683597.1 aminoglycoside phosphotransferase family protein [Candidatus Neomarinimicrobiota bacterium]MBT3760376.1 aminoglycoside phosphotransferase family protein [Candidatus Neomarinimicrobiota bacterium]MBT3896546.1 aminoglycoside phosphotransferase family protein [Candidatus Neomarinimicrobiota bacterium]MBT4173540.1 aminoglycoside phosphotransferase family protein [Candidatus Neomarinimicrobiota
MVFLDGGREKQIVRDGDMVRRPCGPWTKNIHNLLHSVRSQGFLKVPEPHSIDGNGCEILSYIHGEVSNYPLSDSASSVEALRSAAILLREFHDSTISYLKTMMGNEKWWLPAREPSEVICHGDYAPYNVVLHGKEAIGIIDFDTAHPGPRVWDISYALYRWVPLMNPNNHNGFGNEESKIERIKIFCDAYGLLDSDKSLLISTLIERLQILVKFMISEAESGNDSFKANIADGHHLLYLADVDYLKKQENYYQKHL